MKTDLTVLLDRSGSMQSARADYIGGFNRFLADQKRVPGECAVTLIQFNTEDETIYQGAPLASVSPLTEQSFVPHGATALYDALCRAIDSAGRRLAAMPLDERPAKVIFVILTDGENNASHDYTVEDVHARITLQHDQYHWEFVFLAANQDAFASGAAMGISGSTTQCFEASKEGIASGYGRTGDMVRTLRGG